MRESEIRKHIDAYVKGRLSGEEIEALWVELAKNPELLKVLEVEVGLKKLLADQKSTKKTEAVIHKLPRWTWHAAAAAVILLVALLQLFRVETPTELREFVVADIEAKQLETADALRGDETGISPADSLLNLGFNAFLSGDEQKALSFFDEIIHSYEEEPYLSKAFLNKGIILYNSGTFEDAAAAFKEAADRAEQSTMIQEKAWWYLGNALVNLGQPEEARAAVFKAYQLNGIFRNPAFRLLIKLNEELGFNDYEEDFEPRELD